MRVPAPKQYLDWIRSKDPSIMDEIPETKKFKGSRVTRFFLRDASDELMEQMLDVSLGQFSSQMLPNQWKPFISDSNL